MVAGRLQEKKGYFYIVLSYKDEKSISKTKWISTGLPVKRNKKKAEAMLLDARKNFKLTSVVDEADITFADFMVDWLELIKPNIELTTYAGYSININQIICPYFEAKNILLRDIQPKHIQDFYSHCMAERGISANTVIHYHANIRKALKHAVNIDLLPNNPADRIQRPKRKQFVGKFYDIDEVNTLLRVVRGKRIELPVMLAAFYGLRRGEIVGIKWDAIDFVNKTITIRHTVTGAMIDGEYTTIVKDRAKTKSSCRSLPLVPEFVTMLTQLKQQQAEHQAICGNSYNRDFLEYICVDELGNRINPGYITDNFKQTLVKNNLRKIRFQDLRHTCASLLLAAGVSMKEIQEWLGHSNFGTTANTYTHLTVDSKQKAANAMRSTGMNLAMCQ